MARRNASFGAIAAADLASDERLAELFVEAVARGWWANGNRAVLELWCLAEKALQDDTLGTPGRLFHALVKAGDLSRVTDAQEARAMRRMPANDREALALRAAGAAASPAPAPEVDAEALFGPSPIGFHHSVMMMCFLPQKRLPPGERSYATRHGRAALSVEAGSLANPENVGEIRRCAVPFGSRARMVVPYVNACAVRNRGPEVDLGRSLRVFLARLGLSFDGRREIRGEHRAQRFGVDMHFTPGRNAGGAVGEPGVEVHAAGRAGELREVAHVDRDGALGERGVVVVGEAHRGLPHQPLGRVAGHPEGHLVRDPPGAGDGAVAGPLAEHDARRGDRLDLLGDGLAAAPVEREPQAGEGHAKASPRSTSGPRFRTAQALT